MTVSKAKSADNPKLAFFECIPQNTNCNTRDDYKINKLFGVMFLSVCSSENTLVWSAKVDMSCILLEFRVYCILFPNFDWTQRFFLWNFYFYFHTIQRIFFKDISISLRYSVAFYYENPRQFVCILCIEFPLSVCECDVHWVWIIRHNHIVWFVSAK